MSQFNIQFFGHSVQDQLPQEDSLSVIVRLEGGRLVPAQFHRLGDDTRFDYVGEDPIEGATHWFSNINFNI